MAGEELKKYGQNKKRGINPLSDKESKSKLFSKRVQELLVHLLTLLLFLQDV